MNNSNFLVDSIIAGGFPSIAIGTVLIMMSVASAASLITEALRMGRAFWKMDESIGNPSSNTDDIWSEIRVHVAQTTSMTSMHDETFLNSLAGRGNNASVILASVGANAPYIGLLGTVVGVYGALEKIGGGALGMQDIAPPVGEALAMTAIGLLVAIPAVMGYNLVNRAKMKLTRMSTNYCIAMRAHGINAEIHDREINRTAAKIQKIKKIIRKK